MDSGISETLVWEEFPWFFFFPLNVDDTDFLKGKWGDLSRVVCQTFSTEVLSLLKQTGRLLFTSIERRFQSWYPFLPIYWALKLLIKWWKKRKQDIICDYGVLGLCFRTAKKVVNWGLTAGSWDPSCVLMCWPRFIRMQLLTIYWIWTREISLYNLLYIIPWSKRSGFPEKSSDKCIPSSFSQQCPQGHIAEDFSRKDLQDNFFEQKCISCP